VLGEPDGGAAAQQSRPADICRSPTRRSGRRT
jgi:hypothetical protein